MKTSIRTLAAPWAAVLVLAWAPAAPAADATASPQAQYRQQRADCMAGRTAQDRATCLREAGAAYAEARRGTLGDGDEVTWARNAVARCERVPEADRDACERMARGEGTQEGSVKEGAVLKEMVTRSVEPAASAAGR